MTEPGPQPAAAAYPAAWEADVVLSDGGTVHLRPIRPTDSDALVALHGRLSQRTRYFRFFSVYPVMPARDVQRFVNVDHRDRVALVAELGGDLIGVGRFDRIDEETDAECAFVIEDAHHGRGIGSVLLEHLAAAGRDVGVRRFLADVLPDNGPMQRVFLNSGYPVELSHVEGVVRFTFPIAETERSLAVRRRREQWGEARSIARVLRPGSVAVIGAGRDPSSVGHQIVRNLLAEPFSGPVYPVNPHGTQVAGRAGYASVGQIPDPVELAVVAVPAPAVPGVVEECGAEGVRSLVIVSSGFAEAGEAGQIAQRRVVEIARSFGMRVVGPNALGVVNTDRAVQLNATLAQRVPEPGTVGVFCQSAALGIAIIDQLVVRGLGVSSFVSAGDRVDVGGNDLLQFWEDDPATGVVLLYLESFGDPRKFARLARRVARRKPIAAVKSGRNLTAVPGRPPREITLPEQSVQAMFEESGVIRVDTLVQLLDVAELLAHQPLPAGRRVAIVSNSAALGVLAADACLVERLEIAAGSPVDVGSSAPPEEFAAALRTAIASPASDAVVAVFVPPRAITGAEAADVLAEAALPGAKPVVSSFLGVPGAPGRPRRSAADGGPARGRVPAYPSPEAAVQALARVVRYAEWRQRPIGAYPEMVGLDPAAADLLVERALRRGDGQVRLDPADTAVLLAAYGIRLTPATTVNSADEAVSAARRYGYPVVLKSVLRSLRHRVDLGGVRLDLSSERQVRLAYAAISELAGEADARVVVQPMVPGGVAVTIEVRDDPSFGPMVGFGVSGVAAELLGDQAYRSAPLSDVDARELVRAPRAAPLLFGYRGAEPVDTDALADLLIRVSRLADEQPEIILLRLDPVVVEPHGLYVLSGTVDLGATLGPRPDTGPRRMP